jgi:hypothetical protein
MQIEIGHHCYRCYHLYADCLRKFYLMDHTFAGPYPEVLPNPLVKLWCVPNDLNVCSLQWLSLQYPYSRKETFILVGHRHFISDGRSNQVRSTADRSKKRSELNQKVLGTGIEPVTYCVLSSRHNQLDHPSFTLLLMWTFWRKSGFYPLAKVTRLSRCSSTDLPVL